MSIEVNDIETLQDYTVGVMARAEHEAKQVRAIILAILGGIIWRADTGSIEIRYHDGKLANALWWNSVSGGKYAFVASSTDCQSSWSTAFSHASSTVSASITRCW
jgi:Integron cassette protein VCH_CASS1 chain